MRRKTPKEDSKDSTNLAVSLSTDDSQFFRQTCPECGLDFKTEIHPSQLQWIIAPLVKRITREPRDNNDKDKEYNDSFFYCPYCYDKVNTLECHTEETISYIQRIAVREILLPMIHQVFSPLAGRGSSGGPLSVTISYDRALQPPRPIHGPETNDMKVVHFVCCNQKAKVMENWNFVKKCIYCGTPVDLT